MNSFDSAFEKVCKLVEDFKSNEKRYLSAEYQEAEVRRDFIDKFFEALGWDVYHKIQKNPYEQEVKIESPVNIGRAKKRADYAFFLSPNYNEPVFYVEAKKPVRNLKNKEDYFQVIRYGWNASIPLVVLTDFEEFHIIDSRYKPDINFSINQFIEIFHYNDYLDESKFGKIFYLFSREAVQNNSIEKFTSNLPKLKPKSFQGNLLVSEYKKIDEDFLEELDEIREQLARIFKESNKELNSEQLTEATQRTIDRFVFIRFLEDKYIESDRIISALGDSNSAWRDFKDICTRLNVKYNGIIFKPLKIIDDDIFNEPNRTEFLTICNKFAHNDSNKKSPYDFNTIPIHILGSIYERFLGKVVFARGNSAKLKDKPEVRKAGGIYYTPQYIVQHIIDITLGDLFNNKTPKEISKFRIIDIACGSGSFLISAFDYILRYHHIWYQSHPEQAKKDGCHFTDGKWVLSLKQKKNILTNNIFGVDLDFQAVEVTQMSLFLKLLEDETNATADEMRTMYKETLLPDLSENIVYGNSLLELDYCDTYLYNKDKTINLSEQFYKINKEGGFDIVIGNPPYGAELNNKERKYFERKYNLGTTDTAALMLMKGINILKNNGILCYIIPKGFTYASNWKSLREKLLPKLNTIIDCSKVWKEVKYEMCIAKFVNDYNENVFQSFLRNYSKFQYIGDIDKDDCVDFDLILNGITNEEISLGKKIKTSGFTMRNFKNVRGGMLQKYVSNEGDFKVIGGKQILRYSISKENKGYINKNNIKEEKAFILKDSILVQNIIAHIMKPYPHIKITATIPNSQIRNNSIILDTVNQLICDSNLSSKYYLAILNSKLINWYCYRFIFGNAIRTMHFDNSTTDKIPIPSEDKLVVSHKEDYTRIIECVDETLKLITDISKINSDKEITFIENRKKTLERIIDDHIYKLFELTEEEIKIVEGKE